MTLTSGLWSFKVTGNAAIELVRYEFLIAVVRYNAGM